MNENFDSTRQGVELTLNSDPTDWLALYGTVAFTDARFNGGVFDDDHLPLVPEWQFTGGASVKPCKGLALVLEAVHARGQVAANDLNNRFSDNEYTVVNAKASYTWKQVTGFVAVNNIFDKLYETFPAVQTDFLGNQSRQFNPIAGINFQAGATVKF
jgi:iron complex outermembrane receptor protein